MKGSFEKNDLKITAKRVNGFKGFLAMFHSHIEIVYVLSGKIKMCIDGLEKELSQGELSITFPYTIHSYEEAPEAEAIILMFSPGAVEMFEKELISNKPEIPYVRDVSRFLPLIEKVIKYSDISEKMTTAYLTVVVGEIIRLLDMSRVENLNFNSAQQVLLYCARHYKEDISIKSIAQELFLSESYISKIFSCKLGCSFRDYINSLRVSEAKKMLKNTDIKITDIMYACGFCNQSSFNRIFFNETGMTPGEYRKNEIQNIY